MKVNETSRDYSYIFSFLSKDFVIGNSKFSSNNQEKHRKIMTRKFRMLSNLTKRKFIYFIEYNNTNEQKWKNSLILCLYICLNSTFTS